MDFIQNEKDSNMKVSYIFVADLVFPYHAGKFLDFSWICLTRMLCSHKGFF